MICAAVATMIAKASSSVERGPWRGERPQVELDRTGEARKVASLRGMQFGGRGAKPPLKELSAELIHTSPRPVQSVSSRVVALLRSVGQMRSHGGQVPTALEAVRPCVPHPR